MPADCGVESIQHALRDDLLGRLDANVLHRIAVDFCANQLLQHIQQAGIAQQLEYRGTKVNRCVRRGVRRQHNVKVARTVLTLRRELAYPLRER